MFPFPIVAAFNGDPYWASVSMLLKMEGADGGTTFTDSANKNTITANGNAHTEIDQKKFGVTSCQSDGTGDYLSVTNDSSLDITTGDWTIEFWVYQSSGDYGDVINKRGAGQLRYVSVEISATGYLLFYATSNGSTWNIANGVLSSNNISYSAWNHIAICRNGTEFAVYVNGTKTVVATSSSNLFNDTNNLNIGATGGGANAINAYIDEFRFTKGVARYTANFSIPTEEFPAY